MPPACFLTWKVYPKYTLNHCRVNYNPLKSFPIILNFPNTPLGLILLSEVALSENNLSAQISRDTRFTKHCWILLFYHFFSITRILSGALGVGCFLLSDQKGHWRSFLPDSAYFPSLALSSDKDIILHLQRTELYQNYPSCSLSFQRMYHLNKTELCENDGYE